MTEDNAATWWRRPTSTNRPDIVGERELPDGRTEFLCHNEALFYPYYVAASAPVGPEPELDLDDNKIMSPQLICDLIEDEVAKEEIADRRRQDHIYKLLTRLDDFLHVLCEDHKYAESAQRLHIEVHDAAHEWVNRATGGPE